MAASPNPSLHGFVLDVAPVASTTATSGTAVVVTMRPQPVAFIGDGLHPLEEFRVVLRDESPIAVEVHIPTLATPLDVVTFLLAIVLTIVAGRLWSCPALTIVGRLNLNRVRPP